jgi:metal-responsive CopG/Arc/MetJ family transcriptional regulator
MNDKIKIRIVVDEDEGIVKRLDAIAESEGIARSDVLRRAIRRLLFSMPNVLTDEKFSHDQPEQVAV